MSKFELKNQVITMRKKGYSLKEIVSRSGISKSTVALWCRDVSLTDNQKRILFDKMVKGGHKGRILGAQSNHLKKVAAKNSAYNKMKALFGDISSRDNFITGISLYWAEGSKASSTSGFIFVNSDPVMIKFMYRWLINFMEVKNNDIYIHISINEIHRNREEKVLSFWSNLLDLPLNQFSKTFYMKVKRKKVYENHDDYYGVCRLGVRKSTYLRYEILSLIDILKAGVAQVVRANAS